jgi:hypothetical protein
MSGAVAQSFGTLFGAPNLGYLQTSPPLKSSSYSELATGFAVCGVWALVVWAANRRGFQWTRQTVVATVLGAFTAFWFVWSACTIRGTSHLPVANLVPSKRSDQTLGFLAVLLLSLVLSHIAGRVTWRLALACAIVCAVVTGVAGVVLRSSIPPMSVATALVGAIGVGLVVLTTTRYPQQAWPVGLAAASALALVVTVNPVIFGFGDLRDSTTAKALYSVGEQARHNGTYWATNSMFLDAVVIANGVPSLSGHQTSGPNIATWHKIDPTDEYKNVWNRGASYLEFQFTETNVPVVSLGSTPDQIIVSVNPCQLPSLGFPMSGVISTHQLPNTCLHATMTIRWSGQPAYVYSM